MKIDPRIGILLILGVVASCGTQNSSRGPLGPSSKCDTWEKVLSTEKLHKTVFLVLEGCSGFVNTVNYLIEISGANGARVTVFKYEDASWSPDYSGRTKPTVEWLSDNRLKISIGAVDAIDIQLDKVGDIIIEYNVEHILSLEPPK